MKTVFSLAALAAACLLPFAAYAAGTPSSHAPIGVMGDHLHKKGEFMVGYRFERAHPHGLRSGSEMADSNDVLTTYGEAMTDMDMDMHMLEFMYGVTDDFNLMVMPQYMRMEMTHVSLHGGGHRHTHEKYGWGDTEVTGLYSLFRTPTQELHLNAGLSLPTGKSGETFLNHHNEPYPLPYMMQFGSGTYDPILGFTYTGRADAWTWGAQTLNTIRVGKNDQGYRLGNRYSLTAWGARDVTPWASLSARVEGEAWGNVHGRNADLPLTTVAWADPDEVAGERITAYGGVNLLAPESFGALAGQRLAAEFGVPVYERFSGPQTDTDYRFTLGWQAAF